MAYTFRPDSDGPVYVDVGDKLQFEYKAPVLYGLTETVNIYVGEATFTWAISVLPANFAPDSFIFSPVGPPAELSTKYYYADGSRSGEEIITISGLTEDLEVGISITANLTTSIENYGLKIIGRYNDEYFLPDASEKVKNGDQFTIFAKSQDVVASETKVTVTVGSTSGTWIITTKQQETNKPSPTPNFKDAPSENLNTYVYSNVVQILGLSAEADVSLSSTTPGVVPEFAISSSNNETENSDGYGVLDGVTFGTTGSILNGEYLQLRVLSSNEPNDPITVNISIGDGTGITSWVVTTNAGADKEPNSFLFDDVVGVEPSTLIEGIMIDNNGDPTSIGGLGEPVPVTLLSATSGTTPKIKIGESGSIGSFSNVKVNNGDVIYLYNTSSADENGTVETQIKVGTRTIGTWTIQTKGPPITTPVFSIPPNIPDQPLNTYITSSLVELTAINVPIEITSTNSLISIDSDTPVAGPRTFDPAKNNFVSFSILTSNSLDTPVSTTIKMGDADEFVWSVRTALSIPDQTDIVGTWYSIKNQKYDGYSIGTVLQVLKESANSYGDIEARFPGFIECDGRSLNTFEYRFLHAVISNTYGGTAYNKGVTDQPGATTTFDVPDYRNKRLCGTGIVDGNVGSSKFLPIESGGSNAKVGETGGYWYVDEVDVSGNNPFEQVYPGDSENTGTTSFFFNLGTIRTYGTENIEGEANFTINVGSKLTGKIGGLTNVFVNAPGHEHTFLTTVTESDSGEPVIPWDTKAYYATTDTETTGSIVGPDVDQATIASWLQSEFEKLLNNSKPPLVVGSYSNQVALTGLTSDDINYPTNDTPTFHSFGNFWYTDYATTVAAGLHENLSSTTADAQKGGVIDTRPATCTISTYVSPGSYKPHSHVIGIVQYNDPTKDFTYGNSAGVGITYEEDGESGLGGYGSEFTIEFEQNDVLVGLNEAQFTFSNIKKPEPTFYMDPQRRVPIINPFHKIKYIIKAY